MSGPKLNSLFAGIAVLAVAVVGVPAAAQDSQTAAQTTLSEAAERGAYVFRAAGCYGCHTDEKGGGEPLAGGRALVTPFGTFYSPNITPHPEQGIGAWSDEEFRSALRHGVSPGGDPYYPAFPYTSYTGMTDADIADLQAYLFAQTPVETVNKPHDLGFPYNLRFTVGIWKTLYFEAGAFEPEEAQAAEWNRGAYLVRHLSHCGECHSPRDFLGAVDPERELAGNPQGPDGGKVPDLTPAAGGLAGWSESDIVWAIRDGLTPEGDYLSDSMGEVIEHGTSHLTADDLTAIAIYLKSLPPSDGS
ncbi:c-type cytochrome [Pelagibius litoralis]|uniref:C-type cytochrome n=1 Tax=Pelagibius litoralis TaxID=374515 RepID=A0A967F0H5_9PROT|nr:cytochrome c [Pelagibius litoralis]NIA70893.1 c-type cytochrome [Pelagibius litoralis]